MATIYKYFSGSLVLSLIGIILGYLLGGWQGAYIVTILSILEISLSLDNAIVNAKILESWDHRWRHIFLIYGLPIAVFGMRLVFPVAIVAITTGLGSIEVLKMAINNPNDYANALKAVHHEVAAFGGAFLMMVFLKFFVDVNKYKHWLHYIESPLTKLGQIQAIEAAITILVLFATSSLIGGEEKYEFIIAGIWGLVVYIFAKGIGSLMSGNKNGHTDHIIKQGIGGFLYLEILDASFSFDGVIGAFALSNNLFIIAIGLGIGALFVRSFTIYLVDKGALASLRYLEHGAFWAIGALATIMFLGVKIHIPETITGLIGAILIGLALWHSVVANKNGD